MFRAVRQISAETERGRALADRYEKAYRLVRRDLVAAAEGAFAELFPVVAAKAGTSPADADPKRAAA